MEIAEINTFLNEQLELNEQKLRSLDESVYSNKMNSQNRSIRQIVGHMIDSASNNTHRIVHLQYRESPVSFPNYATEGNNDRWIAIQNYQEEDWNLLINLWKYSHLHILHVITNLKPASLSNQWESEPDVFVTLEEMVLDFPRHFMLHISEIDELINN